MQLRGFGSTWDYWELISRTRPVHGRAVHSPLHSWLVDNQDMRNHDVLKSVYHKRKTLPNQGHSSCRELLLTHMHSSPCLTLLFVPQYNCLGINTRPCFTICVKHRGFLTCFVLTVQLSPVKTMLVVILWSIQICAHAKSLHSTNKSNTKIHFQNRHN